MSILTAINTLLEDAQEANAPVALRTEAARIQRRLAEIAATEAEIKAATRLYAWGSSDNIEVDGDALASRGDEYTWVQAWVLVPNSEIKET